MISLISNTHNFLLTKILTSHNNGTQYSHGHAYPVSLPSQTHLHVHPPEKSAGAHGRPHRRKQHSPIFLQAQINNALSGLDDNESKDLIIRQSLQELAESLVLPPNYLAELPVDLRLDVGLTTSL